ncbi:MAG TPA: tetratricopeptide repeat protein [Candidatus Polarisedimenticolia bacterium]|jgi:tetratricopeptide (TPR) repeat protein|nr:tetratricopeptide repeat protein [Candidatus Polarisedimenticolia bacterium]
MRSHRALLLPLFAAGALSGAAPPAAPTPLDTGLAAMHRGDYLRAASEFKRAAADSPDSPDPVFLLLFSRWSQALFEDNDATAPDPGFDEAYQALVRVTSDRLSRDPKDAPSLAALGGGQVLQAHIDAMRGNYWRAGQGARHGKRSLETALSLDPRLETALFPMGALNYYADRLPLVVRGLRTILFIPGGDAALGLKQIRGVAEEGSRFRVEGRMLFGMLCADRYQRRYRDALRHLERARDEAPDSPVVRAMLASLRMHLGQDEEAEIEFNAAVGLASGEGEEKARQRRWLWLGIAETRLARWNLSGADAALHAAGAESGAQSPALDRGARRLEGELRERLAAVPALQTSGDVTVTMAEAAITARPDMPAGYLLKARLLLDAGKATAADESLARARDTAAADAPVWVKGSIELLSGMTDAALGRSKAARVHWEKAASVRRFREAEQARLLLDQPGPDSAICVP